jgi:hypothetical protein
MNIRSVATRSKAWPLGWLLCVLLVNCSASSDPAQPETSHAGAGNAQMSSSGASSQAGTDNAVTVKDCSNGGDVCAPHASCVPDGTAHRCACNEGYKGDPLVSCNMPAAVHDCRDGTDKCTEHAQCIPKDGAYQCVCDDGYEGDGTTQCSLPDPTACTSCTVEGQACAGGGTCKLRPCDLKLACYAPGASSVCKTIDSKACPATAVFQPCKTCDECGSDAVCVDGACRPTCHDGATDAIACPSSAWPGVTIKCRSEIYCSDPVLKDACMKEIPAACHPDKCTAGSTCPNGKKCVGPSYNCETYPVCESGGFY